ncbi:MAG TPA: antitoxin [Pseudonocardia sp.]|jgi:hypothetical protein
MDFDNVKKLLGEHDDQVDSVLDKVGEFAKEKFAGHDEQIDMLTQKAKDFDFSGGGAGNQPAPEQQPGPEQPPAE